MYSPQQRSSLLRWRISANAMQEKKAVKTDRWEISKARVITRKDLIMLRDQREEKN